MKTALISLACAFVVLSASANGISEDDIVTEFVEESPAGGLVQEITQAGTRHHHHVLKHIHDALNKLKHHRRGHHNKESSAKARERHTARRRAVIVHHKTGGGHQPKKVPDHIVNGHDMHTHVHHQDGYRRL